MTPSVAQRRRLRPTGMVSGLALALASAGWVVLALPAAAEDQDQPMATQAVPAADQAAPGADQPTPTASAASAPAPQASSSGASAPSMDLFSRNTVSVLVDLRMVVANGAKSFVNGGFGKTRFQGNNNGGFQTQFYPAEADLVWEPRFTSSLSANVSVAWQNDHKNPDVGVMEAFLNYLPQQTGPVGFSARAGLMWPEISLEHSTGGAWSVVNTITPSAINSWVGEEVRVVGLEGTLHAMLGQQVVSVTGGLFKYNDTSGTLLSFRGWALQDIKGTAPGNFQLPPRDAFLTGAQEGITQNTLDIDHNPGFYARIDWRPPAPFGAALFYYDNDGDPKAFTQTLQWGWRTRFWNLGINADLDSKTKLLAQAMSGSTIMGFNDNGEPWVHTGFQSAFVLVTRQVGPVAVTGRVEGFQTREHGSEMSPANDEDGWAWTAAARMNLTNNLTLLGEALNVQSWRGTRVDLGGLTSPFESQTVFQLSLRYRL